MADVIRDQWYNDPDYPRDPIEPAKGPIVGIGQFFDWLGTSIAAAQRTWGSETLPAIMDADRDIRTVVSTIAPYIPGNVFPTPGASEKWLRDAGINSVDDLRRKLKDAAEFVPKAADTANTILLLGALFFAYALIKDL